MCCSLALHLTVLFYFLCFCINLLLYKCFFMCQDIEINAHTSHCIYSIRFFFIFSFCIKPNSSFFSRMKTISFLCSRSFCSIYSYKIVCMADFVEWIGFESFDLLYYIVTIFEWLALLQWSLHRYCTIFKCNFKLNFTTVLAFKWFYYNTNSSTKLLEPQC